jgi:N-dimethylarginine dimethylaminohydrolase
MVATLRRVLVHLPGSEYTTELWSGWGYEGEPDREKAVAQHQGYIDILRGHGVEVEFLEEDSSINSTATFDPVIVTDEGAVIMTSGRVERRVETFPMARKMLELEIPIIGWIKDPGFMDGGDTFWLDHDTLCVGRSYRSNDEGFRQLTRILDGIANVVQFDLAHFYGPGKVLHLMSTVSPVDHDAAVVFSKLVPTPLMEMLLEREYRLIDVPDEEWDTLGPNVLAVAPGRVVMCAGNPVTSARLRDAGVDVSEFQADEICFRRASGPTCNSRPLLRTD